MRKLKRLVVGGLVALIAFSVNLEVSNVTSAAQSETNDTLEVEINKKETKWLEGLGFEPNEIADMSKEDLAHIQDQFKGKEGKVISKKVKYFKIEKTKNKDGKIKTKVTETKKEEAIREVEKIKKAKEKKNVTLSFGNTASAASDDSNDGWLKQVFTVSDIGSTYIAKTNYEWLDSAFVSYSDTVGITHGDNVDKIANSEYASHSYKDGNGTHYESDNDADAKDYYGYADKFDLVMTGAGEPAHDQKGYFYFEFVRDKTSDNTADLYGHYRHATGSPYYNISISYGGISLSGSTETAATDTHVDLTY